MRNLDSESQQSRTPPSSDRHPDLTSVDPGSRAAHEYGCGPETETRLRLARTGLRAGTDAPPAALGDDAGMTASTRPGTARARRPRELRPEELRRRLDPSSLPFRTTRDVEPLVGTIGQPRALEAIEFGLGVETHGFNLFVAGTPGTGRRTTVLDYIESRAAALPVPDDWVYVHDFAAPDRPNAIRLPPGSGPRFAEDMVELVATARREIPRAFESDDYDRRRREALAEASERQEELERELMSFAAERGFALKTGLTGVASIPLVDGNPITREDYERLDDETRERITRGGAEIEEHTALYARRLHQAAKEAARKVQELEREVALFAMAPLLQELEERYAALPEVIAHLKAVQKDMVDHLEDFRPEEEVQQLPAGLALPGRFDRYGVNVLVDNSSNGGAPVVIERNPTYYNLLGRVQYRATLGVMVTDFREVKPGALHRASGGFLVLDVLDVLRHPFAWEGLTRALRSGELRVENLAEEFAGTPTTSLRPEPVPISVKVVLIGSQLAYRVLREVDDDFRELFKVKAEFSPELDWTRQHQLNYAAFVSRWVRENDLLHFDRGAVATLIEHGARLRESRAKLTARMMDISDLVSEASYWAGRAGRTVVGAADVELAIRKREYRSDLLEERIQELIDEGTLVIGTTGSRVGEVNGLAVIDLGDHAFGRPTRVSARVSIGRGSIDSIEREIKLSGPIHSKGFLILSGYLQSTYGQEVPLALAATLTFEQSYDEIEGDSASAAELVALVSALAELPLDQGIAMTGSVDQHGRIQAVGGVNHKIEGFYATCKAQGLTGAQGVVVPATNVRNLMLEPEVVEAVRAGQFHVWAVRTVDEALALLGGVRAGARRKDGTFAPDTVHGRAEARLTEYAERMRRATTPPEDDGALGD
jgi:lon-related putative ATP-dependent protease